MVDLSRISQFDLYFLSESARPLIVARARLLDPMVKARLGAGWCERFVSDVKAYREAVERVIREALETTEALRAVGTYARNISEWRALVTGIARHAPAPRRQLLMSAAGWGEGRARRVKEMKEVLLNIKVRLAIVGDELVALGLAPELLQLPGRVLAELESGAGDVAREKAEDGLARSDVAELYRRVNKGISAAWRGAELIDLQENLLSQRDGASPAQKKTSKSRARRARELAVLLEKSLGEARKQARKKAKSVPESLSAVGDESERQAQEEEQAATASSKSPPPSSGSAAGRCALQRAR